MPRLAAIFVLLLLAAGCATGGGDEFDRRLQGLAGSDERALLSAMGRIPDNSYVLDDETKVLQWRWDTSYIAGGLPPMYRRIGGFWMPMGGFPPTLVRQGCIVEWTVVKGVTRSYRWQGDGCSAVTLSSGLP